MKLSSNRDLGKAQQFWGLLKPLGAALTHWESPSPPPRRRVWKTQLKKCRLWKTDLHMLGLHFVPPLHLVGRVSIAIFQLFSAESFMLLLYLLNKLGSCGRSPDRATAGTVRRPARASLPRFIEMIPFAHPRSPDPGSRQAKTCVSDGDLTIPVEQSKAIRFKCNRPV